MGGGQPPPPGAGRQADEADRKDLGRLRWRCRRGIKELDVLLERYVDQRFCAASPHEQQAFRQLLEIEDTYLYAYCLGQAPPPERFRELIERIIL